MKMRDLIKRIIIYIDIFTKKRTREVNGITEKLLKIPKSIKIEQNTKIQYS